MYYSKYDIPINYQTIINPHQLPEKSQKKNLYPNFQVKMKSISNCINIVDKYFLSCFCFQIKEIYLEKSGKQSYHWQELPWFLHKIKAEMQPGGSRKKNGYGFFSDFKYCICTNIENFNQIKVMQNRLFLLLHKKCPYAQRSWITALEKGVPFELREVSLKNKEPYFTETYRKSFPSDPTSDGKVPILIDGENIICESDLVSWYLAEKYPTGTELIPKDPVQGVKSRWMGQSFAPKITSVFNGYKGWKNKSVEEQEQHKKRTQELFQSLNDTLVLPYAIGKQFTMADIMMYPLFQRWCVLEKQFGIKIDKNQDKLMQWINNVQNRESVKNTRQTDDYYIHFYSGFF